MDYFVGRVFYLQVVIFVFLLQRIHKDMCVLVALFACMCIYIHTYVYVYVCNFLVVHIYIIVHFYHSLKDVLSNFQGRL